MKNKKYITQIAMLTTGMFLLVGFLVSVQFVFSQGSGGGSGGGSGDQVQDRDRIQDPTTHDGDEPIQDKDQLQDRDRIQDPIVNTTALPIQDQLRDQDRDRIHINLKSVTEPIGNAQQLRVTMENREQELNQEVMDTKKQYREVIQNQNRIRLAVHAIYASENLLGPIGPQVRQITEQINNSVQATLNAEAKINARGFLTHIFFGGDNKNVQILQQEQEQNRLRIQELKKLIDEASINTEIRNTLMEQVRIMEEEQNRLAQLSEKESRQWGIFSWRF